MERLHYPKAVVGKTLLGMLRMIHQQHPDPAALVRDFDLYRIVLALARNESQVLVSELAGQLLQDFDREGQSQSGESGGDAGDSQKDGDDQTNDQAVAAAGVKAGTVAIPVVQGSGGLEGRGSGGGSDATPADTCTGDDARQGGVGVKVATPRKAKPVSPSAPPRPAPPQSPPLPGGE